MTISAGAVAKSPEAFRTISEVAAELDVPQHVLRFWETRFSQIHPVKRAGGRRYYRPQDLDLLHGIRSLLYFDGYTIKGAQKVLREQGVRHVVDLGKRVAQARGRNPVPGGMAEEPRHARAAIARVHQAHPDAVIETASTQGPDYARRARLQALSQELAAMKERLRAVRNGLRL